jgi:hypothetical protein
MAFSKPIDWIPGKETETKLEAELSNGLKITRPAGPLGLTAFYKGFLVYRKTIDSPEAGNLELVLFPTTWSDDMKKFFNPDHPNRADDSGLTELAPGRIVYRNLAKSVIELGLTTLIHAKFDDWHGDNNKLHPTMDFIPDYGHAFAPMKIILKAACDAGKNDDEKKANVDREIKTALGYVFDRSTIDTVHNALPVIPGDLLISIGDKDSPAAVTLEMRNLYGEPINPRFYLKKLQPIAANELAPVPPFAADEQPQARIKDATDKSLPIRIPIHGGAEFTLIKNGVSDYKSALLWDYQYDTAKESFTTTPSARPGQSPTIPSIDTRAENRINPIWDQDNFSINKYAEYFFCPCELILATIYKEGSVYNTNKGDTHSLRFEKIPTTLNGEFAIDYEELLKISPIDRAAMNAYWELAGGWYTKPSDFTYGGVKSPDKQPQPPKIEASALLEPTDKVGTSPSRLKISWGQIEAINTAKPNLIKRSDMVLPKLGKNTDGKFHYNLIVQDPNLGTRVADAYLRIVGGIKSAADAPDGRPPFTLSNYQLPLKKNKDARVFSEADDPAKDVTWEKLLLVLTKIPKAPKATWLLQPLAKKENVNLHTEFTLPKLKEFLSLPDIAAAQKVLDRYLTLMGKDLKYTNDLGNPVSGKPGVRLAVGPQEGDYFTIVEAQAMSKIYPDKISIGVGQLLIETGIRKLIPWVKKHYPDTLFTDMGVSEQPTGGLVALINWLWKWAWDKRELQIAFIAGYHKQNATIYWNGEKYNGLSYSLGELLTKFDFPRVAAAYNGGRVQKAFTDDDDKDWGMHTWEEYIVPYWSAIAASVKYFDTFTAPDSKVARVRLRPDLETDSGMDAR